MAQRDPRHAHPRLPGTRLDAARGAGDRARRGHVRGHRGVDERGREEFTGAHSRVAARRVPDRCGGAGYVARGVVRSWRLPLTAASAQFRGPVPVYGQRRRYGEHLPHDRRTDGPRHLPLSAERRRGHDPFERRLPGTRPKLMYHPVPIVSDRPIPHRSDDVRQRAVRVHGDADASRGAHGGYRARPTDDRWCRNTASRLGQQHHGRACGHGARQQRP